RDGAPGTRGVVRDAGGEVADGNDGKAVQRVGRSLRGGIEAADRFHRVADELDADRHVIAGGKHVEDAAAQAELAVLVHRVLAREAAVGEYRHELFGIDVLAGLHDGGQRAN